MTARLHQDRFLGRMVSSLLQGLRVTLGVALLFAACARAMEPGEALRLLSSIPWWAPRLALGAVVALEVLVGWGRCFGRTRLCTAFALGLGIVFVGWRYLTGDREADCGCYGKFTWGDELGAVVAGALLLYGVLELSFGRAPIRQGFRWRDLGGATLAVCLSSPVVFGSGESSLSEQLSRSFGPGPMHVVFASLACERCVEFLGSLGEEGPWLVVAKGEECEGLRERFPHLHCLRVDDALWWEHVHPAPPSVYVWGGRAAGASIGTLRVARA